MIDIYGLSGIYIVHFQSNMEENRDSKLQPMRNVLTNLTSRVFSNNSYNQFDAPVPGNEIVTNLTLQMALYFNAYFFPLWIITMGVMLDVKYDYLADTYRVVIIAVICLFSVIEVIRLYLGYLGNLNEMVPELAGFLLLTLALQVPLILFLLLDPQTIRLPLEGAMNVIFVLLIATELIFGFVTIRAMNQQQTAKFHLHEMFQFDSIPHEHVEDVDLQGEVRFRG